MRPVSVETTDGNGALSVSNPGANPIYVEAAIYRWTHDASGADLLAHLDEAIVSPAGTWIGSQAEYRFRFKVPKATSGPEATYRVLLTQVPSRDELAAGRVVTAVTQSIPVFVQPDALAPPVLSGVFVNEHLILIRNAGGRRLRIIGLSQEGQSVATGLVGYALGDSTLRVALRLPVHAGRLDVATDLGPRSIDLRE